MKKLVIFDLDGTLLNTLGDLAASCNYLMEQHGYPTHPLDRYRYLVGNGINKLIERALPAGESSPERAAALRPEFIARYREHLWEHSRPYPGIETLLRTLCQQGILLAVASNKYHEGTVALVQHFFPQVPFAAVFGQREGIPVKPDPAVVRQILSATKMPAEQALYAGDSDVDMRTAAHAGIESVGVCWGFRPACGTRSLGGRPPGRNTARHPPDSPLVSTPFFLPKKKGGAPASLLSF